MSKLIGKLDRVPIPPKHLSSEEKATFRDTARYLLGRGTLHSGDIKNIELYSTLVSAVRRLQEEMQGMPMILETGKVHPAVSGLNQLTTAISKMSSMLELCPAARARGAKTTSKTQRQANNEKDWLNAINVPAADSAPRKKRSARIHS